jgi:hypothetical protein
MNWSSASVAIQSSFSTSWGSATAVAYPGVRYEPAVGTPFVRIAIIPGESLQASMAGVTRRTFRHIGVVIVQCFRPTHEGEKTALTLAENAAAVFRGTTISGIVFRAPTYETVGSSGGWYQVNVTVPFSFDALY